MKIPIYLSNIELEGNNVGYFSTGYRWRSVFDEQIKGFMDINS